MKAPTEPATTKKGLLGRLEKIAFSVSSAGYMGAFGCIDSAILYFYTDILRIGTSLSGTLNLLFSLWDAINDPLIGNYIDNHTSKKGERVRHLFLYCAVPFAVFLILCFVAPEWSIGAKFTLALVARCLYDVFDTFIMTSFDTMKIIGSPEKQDRVSLSQCYSLGGLVGTGVSAILFWVLVDIIGGLRMADGVPDEKFGIFVTVCAFAAISVGGFIFNYFNIKERVHVENNDKKDSLFKSLKILLPERNWQKIMLFRLFVIVSNVLVTSSLAYYCKYVLGDTVYISATYVAYLVGGLIAIPFGKPISKKFGSKGLALAAAGAYILSKVIFVFNPNSMIMLLVNAFIMGAACTYGDIAYSLYNGLLGDVIADKLGKRYDAMITGLGTFFRRLATALSVFIMTQLMAFAKYDGALDVQPDSAIAIIKTFIGWAPMATGIIVLLLALSINIEKDANDVYARQQ